MYDNSPEILALLPECVWYVWGLLRPEKKMPKTSSIALLVWRLAVRDVPPGGRVKNQ